ncbi:MarR family transcriptional regulator [Mycobacterium avium]|uniref:MarR family transcriptional regulator n=1 Tax=Mycobacterium avium TaxID=1764 RepID=UPI001594F720|nr:MarR family transcriptional regulator [Mycobacterium avium]
MAKSRGTTTHTVGQVREDIDGIANNIKLAFSTGARPHHLIVGGPGGGKTHTLDAVLADLHADGVTALALRPLGLGIGSYTDLLYEALRAHDPQLARTAKRDDPSGQDLEELIVRSAAGRPILLVLDDIDRIFGGLSRGAQGNLRAWVETTADVALLASAEIITDPLSRRSWPWFGSFNVTRLQPLTLDNTTELLGLHATQSGRTDVLDWLQNPASRGELASLHARFGGAPRIWTTLCAWLLRADNTPPDGIDQCGWAVLDQLTPYYLPRLRALSPLSARLILALARSDGPMTVNDLAHEIAVTNQNAAAALGRMIPNGWVTREKPPRTTDQRSSLYDIADPAMREYIRMRDFPRSSTEHREPPWPISRAPLPVTSGLSGRLPT